jgi:hypothetical protein
MGGESVTGASVDPDDFQDTRAVVSFRILDLTIGAQDETVGS